MLLRTDRTAGYANGSTGIVQEWFKDEAGEVVRVKCKLASKPAFSVYVVRQDSTWSLESTANSLVEARGEWKRRRNQFPLRATFAMTIRKSQGATLQAGGLYLPVAVQGHGDLYTAVARFQGFADVRVLACSHHDPDQPHAMFTPNIVHEELLIDIDGEEL